MTGFSPLGFCKQAEKLKSREMDEGCLGLGWLADWQTNIGDCRVAFAIENWLKHKTLLSNLICSNQAHFTIYNIEYIQL